jgi:hypothetical protein
MLPRFLAGLAALLAGAPAKQLDLARLYPYVVLAGYAKSGADSDLGHGLHVALVIDEGGTVRSVSAAELAAAKLSPADARSRALDNLDALLKANQIHLQLLSGPSEKPFILVGGHWAAASIILLPKLQTFAENALKTDQLAASIPHREAALIFPNGDKASLDQMRALVREKESGGKTPLTSGLFQLTGHGPVAIAD